MALHVDSEVVLILFIIFAFVGYWCFYWEPNGETDKAAAD